MFVKICGTTSEEDALLAVAMGADALGFIFAPSMRQIAPQKVHDIVKRLPPEVLTVGVFRDEMPERVVEIVHTTGLRAAQLHGHERPEVTRYVKARVPVVFKAFSAGDPHVASAAEHGADAILVDGASPGSGQVFDWALAEDVPASSRLMLAGGLHPGNVASAIELVKPWGVDVASGVESSPGHKDPRALRAFVVAAKQAGERLAPLGPDDDELGPYDWREELM
jgi:phosphoribosylanthranilate isomerase